MNDQLVEHKPSQTALFAALRRALANREYQDDKFGPDDFAEIFLPAHYRFFLRFKRVRENARNQLSATMPGLIQYLIARTAFFDRLFVDALHSQVPQIVLLGAGYDSRAYRFGNLNSATAIYELDAGPTQNRKIECLKAAHVAIPEEVRYVPINFTSESLGDTLGRAGYQDQARTVFLWEGVSYYLDWDGVKQTLGFVGRSPCRESSIAFDYAISIKGEAMNDYYGASEFMKSMQAYHAGEEMRFSMRPGEIESFLAECNLRMLDHLDNEMIEQNYLRTHDGSLIGRMTGIFRLVCASPMG